MLALSLAWAVGETRVAAAESPAPRDIGEAGVHEKSVRALAELGVLNGTGCDPERLCPSDPLPRWAMAVWVVRARQLPGLDSVRGSRFVDVDAHLWWARHVEILADAGITRGCKSADAPHFCPERTVTRAEMASFLVRTLDLSPAPAAGFIDIGDGVHTSAINSLYASGITAGCGAAPLRYCPSRAVTKAEMASFLARALGLVPRDAASDPPQPLGREQEEKVDAAVSTIRQRRTDPHRLDAHGVPDCPPQGTPTGSPGEVEVLRILDGCMIVSYERLNGRTLGEFEQQFVADPTVLSVGHPATVEVSYAVTGGDPRSGDQWFLNELDAQALWDGWPEGADVRVAVLDTGVDGSHRDLAGNVLPGKGSHPGRGNHDGRTDTNGHGTHVAGIIAAMAGNNLDGAGMAPEAKIVPIKVDLWRNPSDTSIPEGIGYATGAIASAVNLRSDIISMSFGGRSSWRAVRMALEVSHRLGVVSVAAAGNDSEDAANHYPAAYDTVISVAATNRSGSLATFSNYGTDVVAAPGRSILSTVPSGMAVYSGTSMAAPMVSAVVAHLKARFPDAAPHDIREAIEQTAQLRAGESRSRLGYGHIQPLDAIEYLSLRFGPPQRPAPPGKASVSAVGGENVISVGWSATADGAAIDQWQLHGDWLPEPQNFSASATGALLAPVPGGRRTVEVRACAAGLCGEWGQAAVVVAEREALPGAATVSARTRGDQVTASWSASGLVARWEVESAGLTGAPLPTATAFTWTAARADTYTIRVRACNSSGCGPWGQTRVAVNLPPSAATVTATGGAGRVTAFWSVVDLVAPVSYWVVDGGGLSGGPLPAATSHTWSGVPAGSYTVSVRACNAAGCGDAHAVSVTVVGPPGPARVTLTGGEGRLSGVWSAVDNGSPISGWELDYGALPGGPPPGASRHTWTNVAEGWYSVRVRACNLHGCGLWGMSAAARVTAPARVPDAPTINFKVHKAMDGSIQVAADWSAAGNGSPVTRWDVDDDGLPGGPDYASRSHTWTSAGAGVPYGTYTLRVRACNRHGCGPEARSAIHVPRSARLSVGGSAVGGPGVTCAAGNPVCLYLRVDINFPSGSYRVQCINEAHGDLVWFDSGWPEWAHPMVWPLSRWCWYGYHDGDRQYVRVFAGGEQVETNRLPWPRP
ncbi:MAG: S8 family serine peptidase [Acidimicrobiaceae bacterium]|nr:S8 family serine peptidase [Acidimicrobiaceae bacterium]